MFLSRGAFPYTAGLSTGPGSFCWELGTLIVHVSGLASISICNAAWVAKGTSHTTSTASNPTSGLLTTKKSISDYVSRCALQVGSQIGTTCAQKLLYERVLCHLLWAFVEARREYEPASSCRRGLRNFFEHCF